MKKIKIYLKSILLPLILGGLVGFLTSKSMDYKDLVQPPLAPPSILFPIVWSILYLLMGISYGRLEEQLKNDMEVDKIYSLQLVINLLWPIFFFVLKWRLFAFFWLLLLIYLVIKMIKTLYQQDKLAGLLQLPYLLWCLFASYLNLSIYLLNK